MGQILNISERGNRAIFDCFISSIELQRRVTVKEKFNANTTTVQRKIKTTVFLTLDLKTPFIYTNCIFL